MKRGAKSVVKLVEPMAQYQMASVAVHRNCHFLAFSHVLLSYISVASTGQFAIFVNI